MYSFPFGPRFCGNNNALNNKLKLRLSLIVTQTKGIFVCLAYVRKKPIIRLLPFQLLAREMEDGKGTYEDDPDRVFTDIGASYNCCSCVQSRAPVSWILGLTLFAVRRESNVGRGMVLITDKLVKWYDK